MSKRFLPVLFITSVMLVSLQLSRAETNNTASKGVKIPEKMVFDTDTHTFTLVEDMSRIEFFGASTLHQFEGLTDRVRGSIVGSLKDMSHAACEVYFPASSLHTHINGLNKSMWENLEIGKYPGVRFILKKVDDVTLDSKAMKAHARITGDLHLHDSVRSVTMPLDIEYINGTLHFTGEYTLDMHDFNLHPKALMFVIKVKKKFRVKVDVYAMLQ